jgi:hypothetical protein
MQLTLEKNFQPTFAVLFEACFTAWAASLAAGFEREVVAIDGKTLRRSFDRKHEHAPLHLVSAWASAQGLVLASAVSKTSPTRSRLCRPCWTSWSCRAAS